MDKRNSKNSTLVGLIELNRLADNLWRLVCIPSPTGEERKAALEFAQMLGECGANVEIDETIPQSPNIIGRLKGRKPGKKIQLAGHIDHIASRHALPERTKNRISGRGSADMKNGLSGILEIIRILNENNRDFPGEVLVTVYGLHEAPVGNSQGLFNLIDNGIKGDAAIVFEGPDDSAAIMANGMSIWNLTIGCEQPSCHELCAEPDRPDLLKEFDLVLGALQRKNAQLHEDYNPYPLLAQESLFIGQIHYGDFYNRLPNSLFMQGTRRWHPDKSFEKVKDDFNKLIGALPLSDSVSVENNWIYVGDSYEVAETETIVKSLISAFQSVYDKPCPVKGHSSVTDACRLVRRAKVPTVLCGFGTETGHADYEFVEIKRLERSCAVALLTVLNFLNSED